MTLGAKKNWFRRYEDYLATPLQEFHGESPQQYIRNRIEQFAAMLFDKKHFDDE